MHRRACGVLFLIPVLCLAAFSGDSTSSPEKVYSVCSDNLKSDCAQKPPKVLESPDPSYSEEGRRNRVSGTVSMKIVVGTDGAVKSTEITRQLGYGMDEQAIKAVRTWRFKPGTKDGKPVPVQINVEVSFRM